MVDDYSPCDPILPFLEFAEFIRSWARVPRRKQIAPETTFEHDLGITGGDGSDLLVAVAKRFNVALSSEEHGYRKTFNLAPNEFLFGSESLLPSLSEFLGRDAPIVRAFTVGELYDTVRQALTKEQESAPES